MDNPATKYVPYPVLHYSYGVIDVIMVRPDETHRSLLRLRRLVLARYRKRMKGIPSSVSVERQRVINRSSWMKRLKHQIRYNWRNWKSRETLEDFLNL